MEHDEVVVFTEEKLGIFAESHGEVGRTETTETVFFTTLENVKGIAVCVCSSEVITEVIFLVNSNCSCDTAAVGYFTVCTVEVDYEFGVSILSAEVPVTGGVHEASERSYVVVFRKDCVVDSSYFAYALSLCFDGSIIAYPAVAVFEPATTGFVVIGVNIFAVFANNVGHCDHTGAVFVETECIDCSTDRIGCGCGAYPNIDASFGFNGFRRSPSGVNGFNFEVFAVGSKCKIINFLFSHTGEPIEYPRIGNCCGFNVAYEGIHSTHFGCEFNPLFVSLDFSLCSFVETFSSERTISFVKVSVCFYDVVDPCLVSCGFGIVVFTNFFEIADTFFKDFGEFFGGESESHGAELMSSKLFFNVEDGAGVIEVENNVCVFGAAVSSDEVINCFLNIFSESVGYFEAGSCIFCFEFFDFCCKFFSIGGFYFGLVGRFIDGVVG